MHKNLEAELVRLANSILEMKNNEEIGTLHKKAQEIYEKLTVLKFVENNLGTIASEKEEVVEVFTEETTTIVEKEVEEEVSTEVESTHKVSLDIFEEKKVEDVFEKTEKSIESEIEETEQVNNVFEEKTDFSKDEAEEISTIKHSLEKEFEDAISADVATNLFERVTKEEPLLEETLEEVEELIEEKKVSLNDSLFKENIQIGLNDRIAFVKHLFEGSQEDFNRVLSQLNSFKTEKEAKSFLNKFVKPDYNWVNKEEYENRLITLIERKFL